MKLSLKKVEACISFLTFLDFQPGEQRQTSFPALSLRITFHCSASATISIGINILPRNSAKLGLYLWEALVPVRYVKVQMKAVGEAADCGNKPVFLR